MGNGYKYNQQHLQHKTNKFLPMLCSRPSMKDVVKSIPKCEDQSISPFSIDPLSPKISCMGQVKRTNKIVGFPTSNNKLTFCNKNHSASFNGVVNVKYSKLKTIFSFKSQTPTYQRRSVVESSSCKREVIFNGASESKGNSVSMLTEIEEMDPPLPVIKRVNTTTSRDGGERNSLWKRRSGGVALKSLQVGQIQFNREHMKQSNAIDVRGDIL